MVFDRAGSAELPERRLSSARIGDVSRWWAVGNVGCGTIEAGYDRPRIVAAR